MTIDEFNRENVSNPYYVFIEKKKGNEYNNIPNFMIK